MSIRIPFDSLSLRCSAGELRSMLAGGMVQRVEQPGEFDLALTVRNHGANHRLILSCHPVYARAHITSVKRPNPPSPPAFCMSCRKHLEGGRIVKLAQRDFDRILDIEVQSQLGSATLVAELMGKHSNLILVAGRGAILDACKRIGPKQSRFRQVQPGKPYVPPPPQPDRLDPFASGIPMIENEIENERPNDPTTQRPNDRQRLAATLMARYEGISPFLAAEIVERASRSSLDEPWEEIFGAASRGEWMPVLIRDARGESIGAYPFPTVQLPSEDQNARETLNLALDHYYGAAIPRAELDAARQSLMSELDQAIRAREKKRASLERSLQEAGRAEDNKQSGELLLANLTRIAPGAESAAVADHYATGSPDRLIPLDPRLSPQQNAEAYFRRYRKARDGAQVQREQLAHVEVVVRGLHAARAELSEARSIGSIRAIRENLKRGGVLRIEIAPEEQKRRASDFGGKRIRTVITPEGWEILIGENSEANDYLTGRVASPNDLWLHVRASASAHVVIRTRNNPSAVPRSVLERAARLAAQHSPSKHASIVPVDYTLKKYVRRPRGAPSGTVVCSNEKTVHVNPISI